jgi:hypothetical protein
MMRRLAWHVIALVLAANYFAFQVELFDDEYEANHPKESQSSSITASVFTWESFDKENAPKAFRFEPDVEIRPLFVLSAPLPPAYHPLRISHTIRDKSPPLLPV